MDGVLVRRRLLPVLFSRPSVSWYLAGDVPAENCIAVYDAIAASSFAASKVNLITPGSHDLTDGTTLPTLVTREGWKFAGGTNHLITDIVPANGYSMLVEFDDCITSTLVPIGEYADNVAFILWNNSVGKVAYGSGGTLSVAPNLERGIIGVAGNKGYRNGVPDAGEIPAWVGLATLPIHIGRMNRPSTPNYNLIGNIRKVAIYNITLSPAQMLAITNAMRTSFPAINALGDGAWSWFADPRAVYYNGKTYVGVTGPTNDVKIHQYTHGGAAITTSLYAAGTKDDHKNPGILIRDSDKRIMVFYSEHNGTTMFMRISTNSEDASAFETQVSLAAQIGGSDFTYPSPIQLLGETNDPIYLFHRNNVAPGTATELCYSKSIDNGANWGAAVRIFNAGVNSYCKIAKNGDDRIDFVWSNGTPAAQMTSLYHCYYQSGNWYKSDGTLIGDVTALPLDALDLTLVYNGATVAGWMWDIAIDATGKPVIVFDTYVTPGTDHRYNYAKWTGAAWDVHEICAAGGTITTSTLYYSGGVCLDHADPAIVYLSKVVASQWEIYKYFTTDGGATWDAGIAITTASQRKNIRPFVPLNSAADVRLVWMYGTYTSSNNFNTRIKGYAE